MSLYVPSPLNAPHPCSVQQGLCANRFACVQAPTGQKCIFYLCKHRARSGSNYCSDKCVARKVNADALDRANPNRQRPIGRCSECFYNHNSEYTCRVVKAHMGAAYAAEPSEAQRTCRGCTKLALATSRYCSKECKASRRGDKGELTPAGPSIKPTSQLCRVKTCAYFVVGSTSFCSLACKKAHRAQAELDAIKDISVRPLQQCLTPGCKQKAARQSAHCSQQCRERYQAQRRATDQSAQVCAAVGCHLAAKPSSKFCSPKCHAASVKPVAEPPVAVAAALAKTCVAKPCEELAKPNSKFCSPRCYQRFKEARMKTKLAEAAAQAQRKHILDPSVKSAVRNMVRSAITQSLDVASQSSGGGIGAKEDANKLMHEIEEAIFRVDTSVSQMYRAKYKAVLEMLNGNDNAYLFRRLRARELEVCAFVKLNKADIAQLRLVEADLMSISKEDSAQSDIQDAPCTASEDRLPDLPDLDLKDLPSRKPSKSERKAVQWSASVSDKEGSSISKRVASESGQASKSTKRTPSAKVVSDEDNTHLNEILWAVPEKVWSGSVLRAGLSCDIWAEQLKGTRIGGLLPKVIGISGVISTNAVVQFVQKLDKAKSSRCADNASCSATRLGATPSMFALCSADGLICRLKAIVHFRTDDNDAKTQLAEWSAALSAKDKCGVSEIEPNCPLYVVPGRHLKALYSADIDAAELYGVVIFRKTMLPGTCDAAPPCAGAGQSVIADSSAVDDRKSGDMLPPPEPVASSDVRTELVVPSHSDGAAVPNYSEMSDEQREEINKKIPELVSLLSSISEGLLHADQPILSSHIPNHAETDSGQSSFTAHHLVPHVVHRAPSPPKLGQSAAEPMSTRHLFEPVTTPTEDDVLPATMVDVLATTLLEGGSNQASMQQSIQALQLLQASADDLKTAAMKQIETAIVRRTGDRESARLAVATLSDSLKLPGSPFTAPLTSATTASFPSAPPHPSPTATSVLRVNPDLAVLRAPNYQPSPPSPLLPFASASETLRPDDMAATLKLQAKLRSREAESASVTSEASRPLSPRSEHLRRDRAFHPSDASRHADVESADRDRDRKFGERQRDVVGRSGGDSGRDYRERDRRSDADRARDERERGARRERDWRNEETTDRDRYTMPTPCVSRPSPHSLMTHSRHAGQARTGRLARAG